MMGTKARLFTPITARSPDELVPADHFYRHLDRVLDLSFVCDLVQDCYAAGIGRPSIDPVVFFRLQLVMFFEGIRSERQLQRLAADRLSVRWYLGFNLDQPLPDHSSLTQAVEDMGIRAYVPLPDWEQNTPYFGASKFTYDAEHDVYVCPHGERLRRTHTAYASQRILYRALANTCRACPLKAACTPGKAGRSVYRSFGEAYLERVRAYQQTAAYQKAMRKRKVWIEPLFAEAKDWHGLRRFRLRRLWRVNCEALLIAAGQNLKRLLAQRGGGRRPLPSGAALAVKRFAMAVEQSSTSPLSPCPPVREMACSSFVLHGDGPS